MTAEQIYRELCKLDPVLQPWEKCEHEWLEPEFTVPMSWEKCAKCGLSGFRQSRPLPVFGCTLLDDAVSYDTVDALLGLCGRSGVEVVQSTMCVFKGESDAKFVVERGNRGVGVGYARSKQVDFDFVEVSVQALSEALLRAFGRWIE